MLSLRRAGRTAILATAITGTLAVPPADAAPDFPIGPGTSTRGIGASIGLEFRNGLVRAAWGDASAELGGNPEPSTSELAFTTVAVAPNGTASVAAAVNVSRATGDQAGDSVAVNPRNPENVVVAGAAAGTCCSEQTFRAASFDGGATWTGTTGLPGAFNGSGAQVAFDSFGNAYLALIDQSDFMRPRLRVYLSVDGGLTFEELPLPVRSDLDSSPSLATGDGVVWVSFTRYDGIARTAAAVARVTGLGAVGPFTIQTAPGSEGARLPDLALGPDGQALVVYEARPASGFTTLNAQLDPDGAGPAGFRPAVAVVNLASYGSEARPSLAYDGGGRANLVYRDQELRPETQDVVLQFSDDDGTTWSPAQRVNDDVASQRRLVPGVAAEAGGGRLAVAWFGQSGGGFRLFGSILDRAIAPATPLSPLNLTAAPVSQTRVDLSWTDRSGNETGFEITRTSNGAAEVLRVSANVTSFSDSGLTADREYTYAVRAVNAAGASTATNVAVARTLAIPPEAPTDLTAAGIGFSRIGLAWKAGERAEAYEIFQAAGGGAFVHVRTTSMTSAVLYGLDEGVTYSFKVRSLNSGGVSVFSNVASATTELAPPAAPTGLAAVPVASFRIDLGWSDASTNEDSFEVAESRNGKSFRVVATLRPQTTSFSRFGLRAGTTYHYRVRACNPAGCSAYSNTATATTPR